MAPGPAFVDELIVEGAEACTQLLGTTIPIASKQGAARIELDSAFTAPKPTGSISNADSRIVLFYFRNHFPE